MLPKNQGSLGFSIIGGTDHSCVPFGANKAGIFISHVSNHNNFHMHFCLIALYASPRIGILTLKFTLLKIENYLRV